MSITKKLIVLIIILAIFTAYYSYNLSKLDITPKAYITNQGDNTVSVIDLKKLIKVKTIKVGVAPLGVTILKKK